MTQNPQYPQFPQVTQAPAVQQYQGQPVQQPALSPYQQPAPVPPPQFAQSGPQMPFMPSFQGLGNAPIFERGNPLDPGTFDLQIERIIAKRTNQKGDALIAEFVILNNYGHPKHRIGDKVSWFQKLIDPNIAFPAIKAFLVAALGKDIRTQKDEIDAVISPNLERILQEAIAAGLTPGAGLNGSRIHVVTFQKLTKPRPVQTPQGLMMQEGVFTVHQWEPYRQAPVQAPSPGQ